MACGARRVSSGEMTAEYPNEAVLGLRDQLFEALRELVHAFDCSDGMTGGAVLREVSNESLQQVYLGLVTVLMRMVVVIYAEERGLLPMEHVHYANTLSLTQLHEHLLADRKAHGEAAMQARAGGWARITALFRALHDGLDAEGARVLPRRSGGFFDPDAFPFLAGRLRLSDARVLRVLNLLLMPRGVRLRFSRLEVEHIGNLYEGLLGLQLVNSHSGALDLQPSELRRKTGSHYTPRALTRPIVEATLRPILASLGPEPTPEAILELKICDPAMGSGAFLVEVCRQLGDSLAAAWMRWGRPLHAPSDDLVSQARIQVARRCIYGVDKNEMAVSLARISLWLTACAIDWPFTFVDHALRRGDSLVGWTREQILGFSWKSARVDAPTTRTRTALKKRIKRAGLARSRIHALDGLLVGEDHETLLREVDETLTPVRKVGHLLLEAFVGGKTAKERDTPRETYLRVIERRGMGALPETPQADGYEPFHWEIEFPEVFKETPIGADGRGPSAIGTPASTNTNASTSRSTRTSRSARTSPSRGFDALLGNPPWVSYAGRAAQPLDPGHRMYFLELYEGFAGYRNLQGLFIERCAHLLRSGGRMGLLIPSSMSEQGGYGPTRLAHDRLCDCDDNLPDLGERSFDEVFQPCMVLRSTKRSGRAPGRRPQRWPIERPDLDAPSRALMAKMDRPALPEALFGERGLQSFGADIKHIADRPDAHHCVPLRVGSDIEPFLRRSTSQYAEAAWFKGRLRAPREWSRVSVLIRQTARFPIAVLSDGAAFRNSILAGFASDEFSAEFLVAYLNATPIRWLHYMRHRDARQGMPQVKIGHLRSVPAPPDDKVVRALAQMGRRLSAANKGLLPDQQRAIDEQVADAFDLTKAERKLQADWAAVAH